MKSHFLVVLAVVSCAFAQDAPFLFRGGVLNGASFASNELPGGGIARGSIFSMFGRGLGPAAGVQVSAFPLGRELAGVSIEVRQGTTRLAAIPLFVIASQINAILPSATPLGDVSVRVTFNGQSSNWAPVRVVDHAPGIFTATGRGRGGAIFQNFVAADRQPTNSGAIAATPGQVGTLWLTGSGAIAGSDSDAPPVGDLPYNVEIFVGGRPVTRKLYSGRAPGSQGSTSSSSICRTTRRWAVLCRSTSASPGPSATRPASRSCRRAGHAPTRTIRSRPRSLRVARSFTR